MRLSWNLLLLACAATTTSHAITYDTWKAQAFTTTEAQDPLISGDLADPDKDGLNNLLEYALYGAPKAANPALFPRGNRSAPGGALTLEYKRRREALDLDYVVEVSNDLVTWKSGFAHVWTTDAVPSDSMTINSVPLVVTDAVTATSQLAVGSGGRQFMRLKVIRSARAGIRNQLALEGKSPSAMLAACQIPTGTYAGYISKYVFPAAVQDRLLNAPANWYLASVALSHFVESQPDLVKAHVNRYITYKLADGTHRIKDPDIFSDNTTGTGYTPWTLWQDNTSDSDDAYAGTLLLLACRYQQLYPSDSWFEDIIPALKDIAYYNIARQAKTDEDEKVYVKATDSAKTFNGLIRNFQKGTPNANVGYLMDNVQAWAGVNALADAMERVGWDGNDVTYYRGWSVAIAQAVHRVLWDEDLQAWRSDDTLNTGHASGKSPLFSAQVSPFYSKLHCQLFPQLYGMPYPGSSAETQRRNNMAWKWVVDHMPNWTQSGEWPPSDPFSHLEIAVVAAQMGETQQVADFLYMARDKWLPGGSVVNGTVSEQVGYWQRLVGH